MLSLSRDDKSVSMSLYIYDSFKGYVFWAKSHRLSCSKAELREVGTMFTISPCVAHHLLHSACMADAASSDGEPSLIL